MSRYWRPLAQTCAGSGVISRCRVLAALILISICFQVRAEVAPFGLAVGTAGYAEAGKLLRSKARVEDSGINKWSGGPMLTAVGDGLGIDGLQSALFIFNGRQVLVGVILKLPKHRFDSIKAYLASKYRLVSAQTPFVGNRSASFRDDAVTIEADAPHLSFDMEVRYLHENLRAAFDRGSADEASQKQRREGANF